MKHWQLLTVALLLAACGADKAPPATPSLEQLQGRWVVINYWASWCKPCIREIPELNALHAKYPGVEVLGVNFDGISGQALQQQVQELGITFPILTTDPAAQLAISRPQVLPTTLILDPSGQLRQTLVGPQTLQSLIDATERAPVVGAESK